MSYFTPANAFLNQEGDVASFNQDNGGAPMPFNMEGEYADIFCADQLINTPSPITYHPDSTVAPAVLPAPTIEYTTAFEEDANMPATTRAKGKGEASGTTAGEATKAVSYFHPTSSFNLNLTNAYKKDPRQC
jgi:hypothetical protein